MRLLVILIGLSVGLLSGELLLRLVYRDSLDFAMEMWKYAVRLKVPDSAAGHTHRRDASAHLMGVPVRLNNVGARGGPLTVPKPPGTRRIIFIGDSFTFGWGVREEDTFVAQLQSALNRAGSADSVRYETVNLGVGNYNTVQELARLREVGLSLDPDLVVIAYYINDAEPYSSQAAGWFANHSYLAAFLRSRWRNIVLQTARNQGVTTYYDGLFQDGAAGWEASRAALKSMANELRTAGVPAVLFLLPDFRSLDDQYPFERQHAMVLQAATEAGLPAVDLLPRFRYTGDDRAYWVTPLDPHPNAAAQAIMVAGMLGPIQAALR